MGYDERRIPYCHCYCSAGDVHDYDDCGDYKTDDTFDDDDDDTWDFCKEEIVVMTTLQK